MANPKILGSMDLYEWQAAIKVSTATPENVLSNRAGSGKVVEITSLIVLSDDDGADVPVDLWLYDQDGTAMNDDTGPYKAAIGADVVAGAVIARIGPASLKITAAGGQVVFDKLSTFTLHEDQSIVLQAGNADDAVVLLRYVVKG